MHTLKLQALRSGPSGASFGFGSSISRSVRCYNANMAQVRMTPDNEGSERQQQQQQQDLMVSASVDRSYPRDPFGNAFEDLQLEQLGASLGQRVRVRQHVNPFKQSLQIPTEPLLWASVYRDPQLPLVVDIGAGSGRFILAYSRGMPGVNMLGLEIRNPLVDRGNAWAGLVGATENVRFEVANATVSLQHMLGGTSPYPGPLSLVTIQFPDPHFKTKHHKRRVVQASLVQSIAALLAPGARVFFQSDVLEVSIAMRDQFERHGGSDFRPTSTEHREGAVFWEEMPESEEDEEEDVEGLLEIGSPAEEEVWASSWAEAGWLIDNPLGVPTEREMMGKQQGLPVYRMMLERI